MNYRHAYHAGNFADVLKHAILVHVISYMTRKDAALRVIDTHAGAGHYDLCGEVAEKTAEWREGIGRVYGMTLPPQLAALLDPYLAIVRAENGGGPLAVYPGSPAIVRRLLRADDVLVTNELHPEDGDALKLLFAGDPQVKVMTLDAWVAVKSLLPPKERRGVVLIDPPFEEPGELDRMVSGLAEAMRRFASGTVLLWYPIKDPRPVDAFHRKIIGLGVPKVLAVELMVRHPADMARLNGSGLVIANPPFTLAATLEAGLPELARRLAQGPGARARVSWLAGTQHARNA